MSSNKTTTATANRPTKPTIVTPKKTTGVSRNQPPAVVQPGPVTVKIVDQMGILQSKRYLKGATEFKSPLEILQPCIKLLNETGGVLTLTGSNEEKNANLDGTKNISFGRLNLISRYEIDPEIFYEVGVLVAFDLHIPRIKVYRGTKVAACTNLCIFSADDIVKFDLSSGINMEQITIFLKELNNHIAESVKIVKRLKAINIQPAMIEQIVGKMMLQTIEQKTLNGQTSILRASELFIDQKSKYYYKQPDFNGWHLFNAFTENYNGKVNFFDIPEKTRDTYKLLKDICLQ